MLDRDALLQAIIAHPEEDVPKLMYADWLEEHESALKAAFHRWPHTIYLDNIPHLQKTRDEGRYQDRWIGAASRKGQPRGMLDYYRNILPGPSPFHCQSVLMKMGFLRSVSCDCKWFLTHVAWLRQQPVIKVAFSDIEPIYSVDGGWSWLSHGVNPPYLGADFIRATIPKCLIPYMNDEIRRHALAYAIGDTAVFRLRSAAMESLSASAVAYLRDGDAHA